MEHVRVSSSYKYLVNSTSLQTLVFTARSYCDNDPPRRTSAAGNYKYIFYTTPYGTSKPIAVSKNTVSKRTPKQGSFSETLKPEAALHIWIRFFFTGGSENKNGFASKEVTAKRFQLVSSCTTCCL